MAPIPTIINRLADEGAPFPDPTPQHMLEFKLKVKCTSNPKAPKDSEDPNILYKDHSSEQTTVNFQAIDIEIFT